MKEISKRATVLVNSCDSYDDVWPIFFTLLNKYWKDCPYEVVINTESKNYVNTHENLNIRCLNLYPAGARPAYGKRLREHLKNIDTEYVIMMMDDFFVRSAVDTATIERLLNWMDEDKQTASICLVHHNDRHNVRYRYQEKELTGYSLRPRFCHFNYDMQASIWRKEALYKAWKNFETAWQWESVSNVRSFDDKNKYYDKDCHTPFAIDYINYKLDEWSGIRKGKWVKETVCELFEKNGIEVDYAKRGFFDPVKDNVKRKVSIKDIFVSLRCSGARRAIPVAWFRLKRLFIVKLLKKPYPENYCDYLRRRYYEKV